MTNRFARVSGSKFVAIVTALMFLAPFVPNHADAVGFFSFADLTIVKNTVGGDGTFGFNVTSFDEFGMPQPFGNPLSVTTENQTGSTASGLIASEPFCLGMSMEDCRARHVYTVAESSQDGWDFVSVNCTSNSADNLITTTETGQAQLMVVPDTQITCTYTNREKGTQDANPPDVTIGLESRDYTSLDHPTVQVSVSDAESGVASQSIKLDDTTVAAGDVLDFFNKPLGDHKLTVTATDAAGNTTSKEVGFRLVATTESTVNDINKAYELGWIHDASRKDIWVTVLVESSTLVQRVEAYYKTIFGSTWALSPIARTRYNQLVKQLVEQGLLLDLDKQYSKQLITVDACNLLKADANWLLNH
jgi:hypothetical protein